MKKLGIKAGSQLLLVGAPDEYVVLLEPLPEGVQFGTQPSESTDIVQMLDAFEIAAQREQRRAQIMRDATDQQPALLFERGLARDSGAQPIAHGGEGRRHLVDLTHP